LNVPKKLFFVYKCDERVPFNLCGKIFIIYWHFLGQMWKYDKLVSSRSTTHWYFCAWVHKFLKSSTLKKAKPRLSSAINHRQVPGCIYFFLENKIPYKLILNNHLIFIPLKFKKLVKTWNIYSLNKLVV